MLGHEPRKRDGEHRWLFFTLRLDTGLEFKRPVLFRAMSVAAAVLRNMDANRAAKHGRVLGDEEL